MSQYLKLLPLCFVFSSCYSIRQAYHFNNLFNSRQSVSSVLQDPNFNPKIQEKLKHTQEILEYAQNAGLNTEGSYGYYIHMEKSDVSHVVQAAYPTRLKFVEWWFPFVGSVPYLGYFSEEERDSKVEELEPYYDINKAKVGAFSSLGWFEDPIYTPMLKRTHGDLAHLFFHELTHRTFWSKGSVQFNENLAEFVANKLTLSFLGETKNSKEIDKYLAARADKRALRLWLKTIRQELKQLYANKSLSKEEILERKSKILESFTGSRKPKFESSGYQKYFLRKPWNNASILAASLYTPDTTRFEKSFRCLGGPPMDLFLAAIKKAEKVTQTAFDALDSLCQKPEKSEGDDGKF